MQKKSVHKPRFDKQREREREGFESGEEDERERGGEGFDHQKWKNCKAEREDL